MKTPLIVVALLFGLAAGASAQSHEHHNHAVPATSSTQPAGVDNPMPGKGDPHRDHTYRAPSFIDSIVHHTGSGTSAEPISTPGSMLMTEKGGWHLMLHGVAFLNGVQQSGPRGADKVFSTNWIMPMAQRKLGPGTLTVRAMFSLEPATITNKRYPLIFQYGETAFNKPIADGQHPHDFFMELAALYDIKLGKDALLSFYVAPVGDPALGPAAFPHRASASENPMATLGHHLQDSTHIAADVITTGFTYKNVRLEASGFHGGEPDESRWDLEQGKIDSWSSRLTVAMGQNWTAQYSVGYLTSPEALHPKDDVRRMTASVAYNKPLYGGNWSTTALWGRNQIVGATPQVLNGYLLESTLRFRRDNYVWTRIENVDRTTDLLNDDHSNSPGHGEHFLARVQGYTFGYARDVPVVPGVQTALGTQVTFYGKPDKLTPLYGNRPTAVAMFLRVRPGVSR